MKGIFSSLKKNVMDISSEKELEKVMKELEALEKVASAIHKEANIEKVIYYILENIIENMGLDFNEGYFYGNPGKSSRYYYVNSFFAKTKLSGSDQELIGEILSEKTSIEKNEELQNLIKKDKISYNLEKFFEESDNLALKRIPYTTLLPIVFEGNSYGILFLGSANKIDDITISEKRIIELFRYNLSLYLHVKELKRKELDNLRFETIGHFAKAIIHEFKTPVSSIKGFVNLSKGKLDDKEKLSKYLDLIMENSNRILKLCTEIEGFSLLEEEEMGRNEHKVSNIIKDVLKDLERELKTAGIKNYLFIEDDFVISGSKEKLEVSIFHIIKNAIEGCDYEKRLNFISIKLFKNEDRNIIEVYDNGIGIEREELENVAEPFYTTKINGAGLGLAIVKDNLKKMNLKVDIESKKDKWTRVLIERRN